MVECGELNRQTLALAMELASDAAIDRWALRGRSLTFGPDNDYIWGIGLWELSGGIKWKIIDRGAPYNPISKVCRLHAKESYYILYRMDIASLNKKSRIFHNSSISTKNYS